jgi:hypothetical protein
MQAAHREAMRHGTPVEPYRDQLPSRNHPVLPLGQLRNRNVRVRARPSQNIDVMVWDGLGGHGAMVSPLALRVVRGV